MTLNATANTAKTTPIRPDIQAMPAYHVQDATGMTKLDAMENPFDLPAPIKAEIAHAIAAAVLNRYPPAGNAALVAEMHAALGIPAGLELMLGNGSDEILHLLIQATASDTTCVMAPVPGFVMYAMSATFNRVRFVGVPLCADFSLDMPAMLRAIAVEKPAVLFVAYPNNPTGNAWAVADIEHLIAAMSQYGGIVVMDEAYQPFAANSWLRRVGEFDNVVLVRTFSKMGLAGIRLGYAVGKPTLIAELNKVRPPYNVNILTEVAARVMLRHLDVLTAQAEVLKQERTRLFAALKNMASQGVTPYPSEANFILARFSGTTSAAACFEALLARKILVKNVAGMSPLLANCLRLTVGSPDENTALIQALEQIL